MIGTPGVDFVFANGLQARDKVVVVLLWLRGISRLTQTAQDTFNSCACVLTSTQHSVQSWFALWEQHGKTIVIVEHGNDLNLVGLA